MAVQRAYEVAMKIGKECPGISAYKIASSVNRVLSVHVAGKLSKYFPLSRYALIRWFNEKFALPIRIPVETIVGWVVRGVKPSVTPLFLSDRRDLEFLTYLVSARMGDGSKRRHDPCLYTSNLSFAENYGILIHCLTKRPVRIKNFKNTTPDGRVISLFKLPANSAISYLIDSGLWKILAILFPRWFIKGLLDSEGEVKVWIHDKKLGSVWLSIYNKNWEVIRYVIFALRILGIPSSKINLSFRKSNGGSQ